MTQPQTEMVELKACPLAQCNGRAELIYAPTGGCYIECTNCGLTTRVIQDDNDDAMNHDLAVRLWNARTIAPDIEELVGALWEAAETTDDQRTARELFAALSKFTNTKGNDRGRETNSRTVREHA